MTQEKYLDLFCIVISLEMKRGHLNWSLCDAARRANVKRSVIYHYFKSKEGLLNHAADTLGQLLFGTHPCQMEHWSNRDLGSSIQVSKEIFKKYPSILAFYFLHRESENEIGQMIRRYEDMAVKKRQYFFKNCDAKTARSLFFIQFGITLDYGKDNDGVERSTETESLGLIRWPSFELKEKRDLGLLHA